MRSSLLAFAVLVLSISPASAQLVGNDTAPGSSCAGTPAGATRMTADPDLDGADVVLICDGSIWRTASEPAASPDRGIQFNSGGVMFASSNFVFTGSQLGIGMSAPQGRLHVEGGDIIFLSNGGGKVGIGTSSPGYQFTVQQTGNNAPVAYFSKSSGGGDLLHAIANGGKAIYGASQSGSGVGVYGSGPSGGYGVYGINNSGIAVYGETTNGTAMRGRAFNVGSIAGYFDGGSNGYGIIVPSGNVGIGMSAPQGRMQVEGGDIVFLSNGGGNVGIGTDSPAAKLDVVGDINYTGVLVDVSDRRQKENIRNLTGALDKLRYIDGVSFTMKDDPEKAVELGLIAQDVEQVYPVLVHTDPEGVKSLNYTGMIGPLVEAVKELDAENSELRSSLEILERRIEAMEEWHQRPQDDPYND